MSVGRYLYAEEFYISGHLQPVGTFNWCKILAVVHNRGVNHDRMDFHVNSPLDEETSANQIYFLVDAPVDDATPTLNQISLPPRATMDVTESFAELRASISRLSVNQIKASSKMSDFQSQVLFEINNLEKEAKLQNTTLSLELLEFKKGFGAQNAVLISDVTAIRSQTKEIQAIKTDLIDLQQKTESSIAHVSDQLSKIIAYINLGGNIKKWESSCRGPQLPPNDRGRSGSGGDDRRSRGGRSESSKRIHDSSGGPRKRDAAYCLQEKR
ncbi:ER membrane protein complex subunit 1-like [Dorcoceras hygrometricum]|uniref:ER membrane protein complex subunit 1-like n=1 Tax=Dorcoceras hygrometricum TaxID=472368 RepID=A0A2Z7C309_9LAMI|nr:ER membrane protein complex subunit 1-like [Dorcoceras hygrometricum]